MNKNWTLPVKYDAMSRALLAEGPELWRTQPIDLHTVAVALGHVVPGAATGQATEVSVLGLDYLPPLNAQAAIAAPWRTTAEDQMLLVASGLPTWNELPESFSWHDLAALRRVKQYTLSKVPILSPPSQYGCGACWAFAIVTALSDRWAIFSADGTNPALSPTFLLSCMGTNERCNGGFPADGGRFLETHGTVSSACWDYSWCTRNQDCVSGSGPDANSDALSQLVPHCTGGRECAHGCSAGRCDTSGTTQLFRAQRGSTQALTDRRSIQLDILENGPVACVARIFGDFVAGSMPSSVYPRADGWARTRGVYVHLPNTSVYDYGSIDCLGAQQRSTQCFMGNHAMVIVGWGVERGVPSFLEGQAGGTVDLPFWWVRNSWGPLWNGDGYCKMAMSDPDTGINMEVALDRPLRIGTQTFGAVTTLLPDCPRLTPFRTQWSSRPQQSISRGLTRPATLPLDVVWVALVVGVVAMGLAAEYWLLRRNRQ